MFVPQFFIHRDYNKVNKEVENSNDFSEVLHLAIFMIHNFRYDDYQT